MDRATRPRSGASADALRVAHPEHRLSGAVATCTFGGPGMDAARRRGGAGRSADARRHLLRAAVRPVGGRCAAATSGSRAASRVCRTGCSSEIQPELARAARLSGCFSPRRSHRCSSRRSTRASAIRDVFVDLVAGVQPYRGLGRRLLATRRVEAGRAGNSACSCALRLLVQ